MITITRQQTLEHSGGFNSRAVGYLNPVWYKFLQFTGEWTAIEEIGTDEVRITLVDDTGLDIMTVGKKIRFSSIDGLYDGSNIGTVLAFDDIGPTYTIDLSGVIFRGASVGGYWTDLTKYKHLRLETRLLDKDENVISKAYSSWYASSNHIGFIDLQTELRSLFYKRETPSYDDTLYKYLSGKQYVLQYRELYIESIPLVEPWISLEETILASPTRKQIKEQYGNNLMDYSLKEGDVTPSGGVGNNFVNDNFIGSLSPWLKTTENTPTIFEDWFWNPGNGGQANNSIPNALYQEVNVVAGNRRMQYQAKTGAFFGVTCEIYAFDDPALYLGVGTGDLVHSHVLDVNDEIIFDDLVTFPTNRQYVGFRFNPFSAGASGFDLLYFRFVLTAGWDDAPKGRFLERQNYPAIWSLGAQGIKKPISFILDQDSPQDFQYQMEWQDINRVAISGQTLPVYSSGPGVYCHQLPDAPAGARYVVVWATKLGDEDTRIAEEVLYELKEFCDPYVLLEYQNSLGGISHHAFMPRHNVSIIPVNEKPITSTYEYDIENSQGNLFKDGSDVRSELVLYDDFVRTADIHWVAEIKTSKQVRILFPNGAVIFCAVLSADTTYVTGTKFSKISVTVKLPNNFNPLLLQPNLAV